MTYITGGKAPLTLISISGQYMFTPYNISDLWFTPVKKN